MGGGGGVENARPKNETSGSCNAQLHVAYGAQKKRMPTVGDQSN